MSTEQSLETFKALVHEAVNAFRRDFRYSEDIAKQAGVMHTRLNQSQRTRSEVGESRASGVIQACSS